MDISVFVCFLPNFLQNFIWGYFFFVLFFKYHLARVKLDRLTLMVLKHTARTHSQQVLYIECDKQDASTTSFPFLSRTVPEAHNLTKIKLSYHGFIANETDFSIKIYSPIHIRNSAMAITARWLHLRNFSMKHEGIPPVIVCLFIFSDLEMVFLVDDCFVQISLTMLFQKTKTIFCIDGAFS